MVATKNISEIKPISEENYAELMTTIVEPELASVRRDGYMTSVSYTHLTLPTKA